MSEGIHIAVESKIGVPELQWLFRDLLKLIVGEESSEELVV